MTILQSKLSFINIISLTLIFNILLIIIKKKNIGKHNEKCKGKILCTHLVLFNLLNFNIYNIF